MTGEHVSGINVSRRSQPCAFFPKQRHVEGTVCNFWWSPDCHQEAEPQNHFQRPSAPCSCFQHAAACSRPSTSPLATPSVLFKPPERACAAAHPIHRARHGPSALLQFSVFQRKKQTKHPNPPRRTCGRLKGLQLLRP